MGAEYVAVMRTLTDYANQKGYLLLGNATPGDGGGGLFFFTLTDIFGNPMIDGDDNGGTTVKPSNKTAAEAGRFKRI